MDTPQATPSEPSARIRRDIESVKKLMEKFVVQVKTRARSSTKKDKFYIEPETGLKFFSKKDIERYLFEGDTRCCRKQPERLTEQEMEALRENNQMAKESATTSTEAIIPKSTSPKRARSSQSVDDEPWYAKSFEEALNAELDDSNFVPNHAISESAPGNTIPMAFGELDISDFEIITELEFKDPTMVDTPSEIQPPPPQASVRLESELAQQNSALLDALPKGQEEGFVIPFDVTSYPIWTEAREAEDQLYWASKTGDENSVDDSWLPPDLR